MRSNSTSVLSLSNTDQSNPHRLTVTDANIWMKLLDRNAPLHFALLRLQLVELIRKAGSDPTGDITPALDFATAQLAPRAPTNPSFLSDLEQTMALLIFREEDLTPQLAELLQPSLRQNVAKEVNETLLLASGERAVATLGDLIAHRAWSQQKAFKERRDVMPEHLELGLDPPKPNKSALKDQSGTTGPGHSDAMTIGWDGQS